MLHHCPIFAGKNRIDIEACIAFGPRYNPSNRTITQSECQNQIRGNCWVVPLDTAATFYRCIPQYEVSSDSSSRCIRPEGVSSVNDPACILREDNNNGTVVRTAQPNLLFDSLNSAGMTWGRYFADIQLTASVIFVSSIIIGVVLGFAWMVFLRYCTCVIVWTTILLTLFGSIALTFYFYFLGGILVVEDVPGLEDALAQQGDTTFQESLNSDKDSEQAYAIMAYVGTVCCILLLALVIAMRNSIQNAINIISVSAIAVYSNPAIIFFPLTTVAGLVCFYLWWLYVAAALATAGEISQQDVTASVEAATANLPFSNSTASSDLLANANATFESFETNDISQYLLAYHFFGLLWTNQFIIQIGTMSIGMTIAGWYFSMDKKVGENGSFCESKEVPVYTRNPCCYGGFYVFSNLWLIIKTHLGTIAFASFLIALVQFIRAVFEYIVNKIKEASNGEPNIVMQYIICCIRSCLGCLQWLVDTLARNVLIVTAIKGYSFCYATGDVLKLIISNFGLFSVLSVLASLVTFLGKILLSVASAWVAWYWIDSTESYKAGGENELTSSWLPVLVTFIFAYFVAVAFFSIFQITIDTILVCYIIDKAESPTKTPIHFECGGHTSLKTTIDEEEKAAHGQDAKEVANASGAVVSSGNGAALVDVQSPVQGGAAGHA